MTFIERDEILQSSDFIGRVRIAFCDWLEYWAVTGTASIEDEETREYTDQLIKVSLSNPEAYVNKLAVLVISEPAVKDAVEITDANVTTAVTIVLSHALPYVL